MAWLTAIPGVSAVTSLFTQSKSIYGNQSLEANDEEYLSFQLSTTDYFVKHILKAKVNDKVVNWCDVNCDESVSKEMKRALRQKLKNKVNIDGTITPRDIAVVINSMRTLKMDVDRAPAEIEWSWYNSLAQKVKGTFGWNSEESKAV